MHIEYLECTEFRNLRDINCDLKAGTVVFRGDNGQGKTNILEAIYLAATGKSFRHATAAELTRHDRAASRVRARFVRHDVRHDIDIRLKGRRRSIRVDGRGLRSAAGLLKLVNVVAFFPDDLRVIKGSAEQRRRFLDRAVANHHPEFVESSVRYLKALRSRNALLRAASVDRAQLEAYDVQLIEHGTVIDQCRRATLDLLRPRTQRQFAAIMDSGQPLEADLSSGLSGNVAFEAAAFQVSLQTAYARDRARGSTSVGPHRADLVVTLSGQPARQFASQGQQRAIVLALKLAEVAELREQLGSAPVLLLDDVSSELDRHRTKQLFESVGALDSQVLVTTTGAVSLPLAADTTVFTVDNGTLTQV